MIFLVLGFVIEACSWVSFCSSGGGGGGGGVPEEDENERSAAHSYLHMIYFIFFHPNHFRNIKPMPIFNGKQRILPVRSIQNSKLLL